MESDQRESKLKSRRDRQLAVITIKDTRELSLGMGRKESKVKQPLSKNTMNQMLMIPDKKEDKESKTCNTEVEREQLIAEVKPTKEKADLTPEGTAVEEAAAEDQEEIAEVVEETVEEEEVIAEAEEVTAEEVENQEAVEIQEEEEGEEETAEEVYWGREAGFDIMTYVCMSYKISHIYN